MLLKDTYFCILQFLQETTSTYPNTHIFVEVGLNPLAAKKSHTVGAVSSKTLLKDGFCYA